MAEPPKKSGGFSLYADLLDPDKGSTISGAPVKYDLQRNGSGSDEQAPQKKRDASLKFQPVRRPQVPQKKMKPKTSSSSSSAHKFSSSIVTAASASSPDKQQGLASSTPAHQAPSLQKSKFSDWVGSDNDEYYYQDPRARGGRKNKKKKNRNQERMWDWDDIYDPTQPNVYADYKRSEEQTREIRDWKARLYYHQLKGSEKAGSNRIGHSDSETEQKPRPTNVMFAPPKTMNFAPPSFDDAPAPPPFEDDDDYFPPANYGPQHTRPSGTPPSFAPAPVPDDPTGEDAYARRMRMSSTAAPSPPMMAQSTTTPPPPPPPSAPGNGMTDAELAAKKAEAQAKIAAFKAKLQKPPPKPSSASPARVPSSMGNLPVIDAGANANAPSPPPPPPATSGSTISRAPVRYEVPRPLTESADTPMPDADDNSANENQPRSNRPGKKGFAERLLKKYGWEKGHGLGAQGEGITTALFMKADKRKKRPNDPDGGKGAPMPNMGKIVGGKKRKIEGEGSDSESTDPRYGKMSEVIKLESMLDGLDVQHEIEENNLMQEIGEHMGGTYGNVERVFIWREAMGGMNEVFVKFTSPLSALNAVNGMAGTEFAGNEVKAKFWEVEKFENGDYA